MNRPKTTISPTCRGLLPVLSVLLIPILLLFFSCSPVVKRSSFFKYESFVAQARFHPGGPPPGISTDSPAALLMKGYIPLGYFEVKHVSQGEAIPDTKDEALSLAGGHGADLVVLSSDNETRDDVVTKRGRCLKTRSYSEVSWEASSGAFGALRDISECSKWEEIIEKTRVVITKGTAWEHDPDTVPKAILTVFFNAVNDGDNKTMRELVENDLVDINTRDTFGWTPLMILAVDNNSGNIDQAGFLIRKGAAVNLRDNEGKTALMLSASRGNLDMFRFLIKQHADTTVKDKDGKTAIDLVPPSMRKEFVRSLK